MFSGSIHVFTSPAATLWTRSLVCPTVSESHLSIKAAFVVVAPCNSLQDSASLALAASGHEPSVLSLPSVRSSGLAGGVDREQRGRDVRTMTRAEVNRQLVHCLAHRSLPDLMPWVPLEHPDEPVRLERGQPP